MSSISASMNIAIVEIKEQLDKKAPIKDRLRQAMKLAMNHWLVVAEQERFRCAVGAVMLTASDEERRILSEEMKSLNALSASMQGVPVDFNTVIEAADVEKWYRLMPLWKEVRKTMRG